MVPVRTVEARVDEPRRSTPRLRRVLRRTPAAETPPYHVTTQANNGNQGPGSYQLLHGAPCGGVAGPGADRLTDVCSDRSWVARFERPPEPVFWL